MRGMRREIPSGEMQQFYLYMPYRMKSIGVAFQNICSRRSNETCICNQAQNNLFENYGKSMAYKPIVYLWGKRIRVKTQILCEANGNEHLPKHYEMRNVL